jgi:hypothetical protein
MFFYYSTPWLEYRPVLSALKTMDQKRIHIEGTGLQILLSYACTNHKIDESLHLYQNKYTKISLDAAMNLIHTKLH